MSLQFLSFVFDSSILFLIANTYSTAFFASSYFLVIITKG